MVRLVRSSVVHVGLKGDHSRHSSRTVEIVDDGGNMYGTSYDEVVEDAPKLYRERERAALERAIRLLEEANAAGAGSKAPAEALFYVGRLWRAFIEDLMSSDNDLPETLRADLVSVGLWILKEVDLILADRSRNFLGLAEVCGMIRDGLN